MFLRRRNLFTVSMLSNPMLYREELCCSTGREFGREILWGRCYLLLLYSLLSSVLVRMDLRRIYSYADGGKTVRSVAEVATAQLLLGTEYCSFLMSHNISLLWLPMDCEHLRLVFDERLDVDDDVSTSRYRQGGITSWPLQLQEAALHCGMRQGWRRLGNYCKHGQCADCDPAASLLPVRCSFHVCI
jgi:hypothetical protein